MRRKIEMGVLVVALIVVGIMPRLVTAQDAPAISLEDQLKAQYTLVKMGADTGGAAVVEQGTILVIKKGGVLSVPYGDSSVVPTKYQDGTVHSPNNIDAGGRKSISLQDLCQSAQGSGRGEHYRLRFL